METDYKFCKNCGEVVEKNFCPNCGQEYKEFDLTIRHVFSDFFHDILDFDSRFFRTLKTLLFNPGKLSSEYIRGRRVRYLSPFRIYLIITILFFIVLNLQKNTIPKIKSAYQDIREHGIIIDSTQVQKRLAPQLNEKVEPDSTGKSRFKFMNSDIQLNEKKFFQMYLTTLRNLIIFLFPILALILKLFYIRRQQLYINHLIFTVHVHCIIIFGLLITLFHDITIIDIIVFMLVNLYIVISMKKFYQQTWIKTILKYCLIFTLYVINLTIFAVISLLIPFIGMYYGF